MYKQVLHDEIFDGKFFASLNIRQNISLKINAQYCKYRVLIFCFTNKKINNALSFKKVNALKNSTTQNEK